MNKTKYQAEQYSELVDNSAKLINQLYRELADQWNLQADPNHQIFFSQLASNGKGQKVVFSPNLRDPKNVDCLGYMQSFGYKKRIFLSEKLLSDTVSYATLKEVAAHEFAHFIDSSIYGQIAHGSTFKDICKILNIENNEAHLKHILTQASKNSNVLEKIKKLLALSESSNINEAESALLKAKNLMREYGIKERENSDEKIYRVILTEYKTYTSELTTLVSIAKKISNCWILLSSSTTSAKQKVVYAHGTKTECEIASYIYDYLKIELAKQYEALKKAGKVSGNAKKSFYLGIDAEMSNRFNQQDSEVSHALVSYNAMNEKLSRERLYATTKFRTKSSSSRVSNYGAYASGKEIGKSLKIRNGLNSGNSGSVLALN